MSCGPRVKARSQFEAGFKGETDATAEESCGEPDVEAFHVVILHRFGAVYIRIAQQERSTYR